MLLQLAAEVESGDFIKNALTVQSCRLALDGGLMERLRHGNVAVAERALRQMSCSIAISG